MAIDTPRPRPDVLPASAPGFPRPMSTMLSPKVLPVLLLVASNVFMTFAWYGHLKFKSAPLHAAVLFSWAIAFFEYWLAVPANRIGYQAYSAAELKTIQEVVTLCVFAMFTVLYLRGALPGTTRRGSR
jgi:uncharacterized protein (DUF486 family)